MRGWLRAVEDHGSIAREVVIGMGVHPRVVLAKAERAERKGYAESGVVVDRQWLTEKGRSWLLWGRDGPPTVGVQ
jgi:hypothetical protein